MTKKKQKRKPKNMTSLKAQRKELVKQLRPLVHKKSGGWKILKSYLVGTTWRSPVSRHEFQEYYDKIVQSSGVNSELELKELTIPVVWSSVSTLPIIIAAFVLAPSLKELQNFMNAKIFFGRCMTCICIGTSLIYIGSDFLVGSSEFQSIFKLYWNNHYFPGRFI